MNDYYEIWRDDIYNRRLGSTRSREIHGRPTNDAIRIALAYNNACVDTAFMPVDVIDAFITKGLSSKLLWGTDMCIPKHFYPNCDLVVYYKTKLQQLSSVCNKEQFEAVTYKNVMTLFAIKE